MTALALRRSPPSRARAPRHGRSAPRAVRLPLAPSRLRHWTETGAALLVIAAGTAGLWALKVPHQFADAAVRWTVAAGFEVRSVEITGLDHLPREPVFAAATAGPSSAMLLTSVSDIRERLLALPWVADATVARALPDRLRIRVKERTPVALWQRNRRLAVVDAGGRVLDTRGVERFARLPVVVGEGAEREVGALLGLLSTQPVIAPHVRGAVWVGGRRWDLKLRSGETLSLPEGYARAQEALATFAKLDAKQGLRGRGFARFDLRLPDRLVVRVTDEPGATALPVEGTPI